jgi:hypothetical protein
MIYIKIDRKKQTYGACKYILNIRRAREISGNGQRDRDRDRVGVK